MLLHRHKNKHLAKRLECSFTVFAISSEFVWEGPEVCLSNSPVLYLFFLPRTTTVQCCLYHLLLKHVFKQLSQITLLTLYRYTQV